MEVNEECVKDRSGRVLSNGSEVCDRWKEYFDGLLSVSERAEISARPRMNVTVFEKAVAEISASEVLGAIRKMKSGKASGVDGVKLEYLKGEGEICA